MDDCRSERIKTHTILPKIIEFVRTPRSLASRVFPAVYAYFSAWYLCPWAVDPFYTIYASIPAEFILNRIDIC